MAIVGLDKAESSLIRRRSIPSTNRRRLSHGASGRIIRSNASVDVNCGGWSCFGEPVRGWDLGFDRAGRLVGFDICGPWSSAS